MSTRIVERHGIRRLIPKCRQYFRPIVPLQYVWLNRKKGAAMNQTDKVLYTAAVHTTGGREGPRLRRHCCKTSLAKPRAPGAWCMKSQAFRSAPRSSWKEALCQLQDLQRRR